MQKNVARIVVAKTIQKLKVGGSAKKIFLWVRSSKTDTK